MSHEHIVIGSNNILNNEFSPVFGGNYLNYKQYINAIGSQTLRNLMLESIIHSDRFVLENDRFYLKNNVKIEQLAGHIFEAFVVKLTEIEFNLKPNLLQWCTGLSYINFLNNYGYDNYLNFITSVKILAKGANNTKIWHPNNFCSACKNDIEFIVKDLSIASKPRISIGNFQVKAISCGEKYSIINRIRSGEYNYVLTLLNGSKDRCEKILYKMIDKKEITIDEAQYLYSRIGNLEMFNIPQELIDYVYNQLIKLYRKGKNIYKMDNVVGLLEGISSYAIAEDNEFSILVNANNL